MQQQQLLQQLQREKASEESKSAALVIVWDFDWSLVDENSDTFIVQELAADLMPDFSRLRKEGLGWTKIMACMMQSLFERGVTREVMEDVLARLPVQEKMMDAVLLAAKAGAWQIIVSDANEFFIDCILQARGIREHFARVVTNSAQWSGGLLHIGPHQSDLEPHGCTLCPSNLCKGGVLRRLQEEQPWGRDQCASFIYVGDGGGDFCPIQDLASGDLALARSDPSSPTRFALLSKLKSSPADLSCDVEAWVDGKNVYDAVARKLQQMT
jgi:pyridoxal phosphate phosphatase PHOSPHO2